MAFSNPLTNFLVGGGLKLFGFAFYLAQILSGDRSQVSQFPGVKKSVWKVPPLKIINGLLFIMGCKFYNILWITSKYLKDYKIGCGMCKSKHCK